MREVKGMEGRSRTRTWLISIGLLILLFMLYPGEKANAATKTDSMKITLDLFEIDDPDTPVDNYLKFHIAEATYNKDCFAIKILSKTIIERGLDVDFTVKFTNMSGIFDTGKIITVTGYKKDDELVQQIKDTLKAGNDRIEEIYELKDVEARYIIYDVSYQYNTDDISVPQTIDTEKLAAEADFNITSPYLCKGETLQLKLKKFSKKIDKMIWTSENKKIAKVSKSGKITGVNYGSTVINLSVYSGGKEYYYSSYVTVYKLKGFEDGVTKLTLDRGAGDLELCDVKAVLNIKGAEDSIESYAIPCSRVKVDITPEGKHLADIEEIHYIGVDGITYLGGFNIKTYRDGIVTITVSDKKTTCKLELVIGTGVCRLDPVEAVKNNDFTGYEGTELKTLQKVRELFDKNNMYSDSVPTEKKIQYIVDYFIQTYKDERYIPYEHGTLYRTIIDGHGVCGDYSETVCFLLDCLGINNIEECGIANGGSHAWNKVEVNGKWYNLDAFWCACLRSSSTYFLTEKLWDDHVMTYEDNYYEDGDIPYINSLR